MVLKNIATMITLFMSDLFINEQYNGIHESYLHLIMATCRH